MKSFGTEDRHPSNSDTFVPAGDNVYEYIVFRGSDVKDLRIEKEPEELKQQVPDDPAILGVSLFCSTTIPRPERSGMLLRMTKYTGCKLIFYHRERKTVWIFPLPSF